jgi:N-acetylneuraminic acid mutarotase
VTKEGLFAIASFIWAVRGGPLEAECPGGARVSLAPMSEPRQEMAAAELGGRIYAVGGLAGRANANTIYDPSGNSWSVGADLPVMTDHAWAVSLGGRLYVGGGSSNRVFAYDPAADRWTEAAPSAYVHGGTPVAAVIAGQIYVAGGAGGTMVGNELEAYDPASNRWTTRTPMSCARNHTAGGAIGGKLYVAGGRPGSQDCLEIYDPAADAWTRKAAMPTGRSGAAGAIVGDCLYVFGGEGNASDPNGIFHQVEAYEASSNSWRQLPSMQTARHGIYAATIGNVIYLPGGATNQGIGVTAVNEAYVIDVPSSLPPRQKVVLPPRRTRHPGSP